MSNPFVGEIRIFPFNFAPLGWAMCNGQILPISQNTALFSLLGTTFGGNGTSTFALPNLQGVSAMSWGQGPGLSLRDLGEGGGEQAVTLLASEMPQHTHVLQAGGSGNAVSPESAVFATTPRGKPPAYASPGSSVNMSASALSVVGGSQPHNNLPPYLVVNFCIALQGVFPSRG